MALFMRATSNKYSLFINNCYNKLTITNLKLKPCTDLLRHSVILNFCSQRNSPENNDHTEDQEEILNPFYKFIAYRKREAKRSVIIQVQSPDSYQDLYSYCAAFGAINQMKFYSASNRGHFFLIEFQDISSQISLINSATHINHNEILPVKSSMLWFRNVYKKSGKISKNNIPPMPENDIITENRITDSIRSQKSINDQINCLYRLSKLEDIGIRLRFFTALQLEATLIGLFPNVTALPFGSSVNGFGKRNCDLDLILNFEPIKEEKESSRLVFHTKSAMPVERAQTKRSMETIATLMQHFMPGVYDVRRILHARVPIIKYHNSLTDVECDLSMTNMIALYMSELLYLYGESDERVRPLVFTIRKWALDVGITNPSAGPWITNFSLTLMILFFLQHEGILPSLKTLQKLARKNDIRITENCANCTFLRDLSKWPKESHNISLERLLIRFFHFYANFDFSSRAISLNESTNIAKTDESALYIVNPLEKTLNVSKNVNDLEIRRFVNATRNAALLLDDKKSCKRGLIDLFAEKQSSTKHFILRENENKINIADLFEKTHIEQSKDGKKTSNVDNSNKDNVEKSSDESNLAKKGVKIKQVRR
ncbi:poly(A) RNA polymerase, mitochondrial [Chelonus insularis]|uniref:poly(A) RNA polymerase, mitochondrial n=1 Tax=Chelonus insularis TaxID=460826 RepID=UPI001588DBE9|nr:poly(A) RNA polymerase, mitochondrial-like [Chelonus insularis]